MLLVKQQQEQDQSDGGECPTSTVEPIHVPTHTLGVSHYSYMYL